MNSSKPIHFMQQLDQAYNSNQNSLNEQLQKIIQNNGKQSTSLIKQIRTEN